MSVTAVTVALSPTRTTGAVAPPTVGGATSGREAADEHHGRTRSASAAAFRTAHPRHRTAREARRPTARRGAGGPSPAPRQRAVGPTPVRRPRATESARRDPDTSQRDAAPRWVGGRGHAAQERRRRARAHLAAAAGRVPAQDRRGGG